MIEQQSVQSSQCDTEPLEQLRVAPNKNAWRIEIERILDGYRDRTLLLKGDAGAYIGWLIKMSEDPAMSRIALQDALEMQVARWKPGRSDAWMLDILRRFTPESGQSRLLEMFRLPGAFAGDPDPRDPEFRGRDLRLQALHALERYFTPSSTYRKGREKNAFVADSDQLALNLYVSVLQEHRDYPRYRSYVSSILSRMPVEDLEARCEEGLQTPVEQLSWEEMLSGELQGSVLKYEEPTEPVGLEDWKSLR